MRDTVTYLTKQTKIREDIIFQIKAYAAQHRLLMQDLYEKAVVELLKHRMNLYRENKRLLYLASPIDGKALNLKLRKPVALHMKMIAKRDKTPARRFLHTAIIYFAKRHKLLNIEIQDGY